MDSQEIATAILSRTASKALPPRLHQIGSRPFMLERAALDFSLRDIL